MTYALSGPLQTAIFSVLAGKTDLTNFVGDSIFDHAPSGQIPGTYLSIGEESVKDASDLTCPGAIHEFVVTVVSDEPGFSTAKIVAGHVSEALANSNPPMSRGRIVSINFMRARAQRTRADARRRIDLRFRIRTEDI